jgi:hypothetical protein
MARVGFSFLTRHALRKGIDRLGRLILLLGRRSCRSVLLLLFRVLPHPVFPLVFSRFPPPKPQRPRTPHRVGFKSVAPAVSGPRKDIQLIGNRQLDLEV